jgi:formylmethanofuran dehydrogenase subunit A
LSIASPGLQITPSAPIFGIAPGNEDLTLPGGTSIHIAGSEKDGKYIITNELKVVPAIVNPQAYPALVHAEAAMRERSATLFLLEHE